VSTEQAAKDGTYAYDQSWRRERERLDSMGALLDEGTTALVEELGIAPGWRCLEVGAGAGSVALWMAQRTGATGEVLATDVSTIHLDGLTAPGLHVRRHDVLTDPLPSDHFDLIHARLVVEHIGGRALDRMVSALRPGGWMLVESFDWVSLTLYPRDEATERTGRALLGVMSDAGFDPQYGRKLVHELDRVGLAEVAARGRSGVYPGGHIAGEFLRLSIEQLGPVLIDSAGLGEADVARALEALGDPANILVTPPMVAAWGRKPGKGS
jgi:SAM-dependent methyltransferase